MNILVRPATEEDRKKSEDWSVWSKEISEFHWKYDTPETCFILEGSATVTPEEGESVSFGVGDFVMFPKGLKCTWKITEPIRKRYQFGG
ncbi:cupin domain-containing protein [Candidatus Peregrinibacteria bacterium]|nr:MAG: cupin domain-containing protein [Candidatus Peregrinibacteria bacterium]